MIYNILFSSYEAIYKILLILAFIFSAMIAISFHEFSHGFVAYKMGDDTAKISGRLTLNPVEHFEPFGLVMFALIGFGWAKPVPINPNNFRELRKGLLLTSFAGVIANFILCFCSFWLMVGFGYLMVTKTLAKFVYYIVFFLFYFALYSCLLNVALIAFNLLPIYPLDGFRVIESLTPFGNRYVVFMHKYGKYILIGIVLLGVIFERIGVPQANLFGEYLTWLQESLLRLYYKLMEAIIA